MELNLKIVYAVIVSCNGITWIHQAIESLQRSTFPVRIVVVDNASSDETVKTIRDLYEGVEVFCMSSNLGFAKANNYGIRYALSKGADYVLLLNQDAKISPPMIDILLNLLEKYHDFGIVSPLHLAYQGKMIDPSFLSFIKDDIDLISDAFLGRMQELYEVNFVNAAVWVVSRQVLEKVGGFDPVYFMYGEDIDYCRRAQFHGFKVGLSPRAIAYHWHGSDISRSVTFNKQCLRLCSEIIHRLKRPDHIFVLSLMGLIVTWTQRSIIMLIYGDFKGFFARVLSFLKVLPKLFLIRQHYRKCKLPGSFWL
jgi:GT2 family glycosyltransferase